MRGMSDTTHRDSMRGKSFRSSKGLLEYCKKIDTGWFRCQAIALGAEKLDAAESQVALRHAIKAAETERDAYRRQAPLVWVVQAMVRCGDHHAAARLAQRLIQTSGRIVPSNSEAYMLEMLFDHYESDDPKLHKQMFRKLMGILDKKGGWRVERACMHTARKLDSLGHNEFVDDCLKGCANSWLHGRVSRNRLRDQHA